MPRRSAPRFLSLSTIALAVVVLATATPNARAEAVPPTLRHDIGAFALYGRTHVKLNGAFAMPRRGAVGSESYVEFSAYTPADGDGSWVAAPVVAARLGTRLHQVFATTLDFSNDVTTAHAPAPFSAPLVAAIDFPRLPEIVCNDVDVFVAAGMSPYTLPAGRYGTLVVDQNQTLKLVPGGRYEFCTVRVRAGATIEATSGNLVLIRDFLTTDAHSRITGEGACGARWVAAGAKTSPAPNASAFAFVHRNGPSDRSLVEGNFFTPGRIAMGQNLDYTGRFWAERIEGLEIETIARTVSDCPTAQCGDGNLDPGEGCDDGNNRDGDCCSALCEPLAAGSSCDDGLFCTVNDVCDAGRRCVGSGSPCDAPDGDANCSEACNEDSDACNAPDPDGSACEDGLWCNGRDLCASGRCDAHADLPCAGPDGDANCRESCHEATRTCTLPDPAGAACNDGRFCTLGELCDASGECSGGYPRCPGPDGDADCAESCDELADACSAADPAGAPCSDGLFCTATDACDGRGSCEGHGDPCNGVVGDGDNDCSEACDEQAGACGSADPDGAPCDDGLACTLGERCVAGACAPGGRTSCDDSNPCTDEFCAPDGACLRDYNALPCDDGNPCTTGDRCVRGACAGTGQVDCRDDDLCSSDFCDPADGTCHHSFTPADDCHAAGRSTMRMRRTYSDAGEAQSWLSTVWIGTETDPAEREELGLLHEGDPFAVCFYDESSGLPELVYRLDLDSTTLDGSTWKRKANFFKLVYRLKSAVGTSQGLARMRLGIDDDGVPTFRLRAGAGPGCKGDCPAKFQPPAPRPDGRQFAMEPGMTVQWRSATGSCWSSRYRDAAVNTSEAFQARAVAP